MNSPAESATETTGQIKKTVCIDADIFERAVVRAKQERRNFSNYVAWLIDRDAAKNEANSKEAA